MFTAILEVLKIFTDIAEKVSSLAESYSFAKEEEAEVNSKIEDLKVKLERTQKSLKLPGTSDRS